MILDGKKLALKLTEELKAEVKALDGVPFLVVVLAGNDAASEIYVRNKLKKADFIGIKSEVVRFDSEVSESEIIDCIEKLNNDDNVNAILVQLPLPKTVDAYKVIETISPKKDVDGFHFSNVGKLAVNKPYICPCTPFGIMRILKEYNIEVEGKHAVVVGRSNVVGRPMAQLLLNANATVTVCHSKTKNLEEITKTADILISAVGKKVIFAPMVKKGAVVIDVGITRGADGKLTGDVDFETVKDIASFITPVPGGVGPMTIASLMHNTVELYKLSR